MWLSLFTALFFCLLWWRQVADDSGMHCDEVEVTCFCGIGVCSFDDHVYVSAFWQPQWKLSLHPRAYFHATSSFGESAAFFNFCLMRQYGTSRGHFGIVASRLENEWPPAYRAPVCAVMLPHWVFISAFLLLPGFRVITTLLRRIKHGKPFHTVEESVSAESIRETSVD